MSQPAYRTGELVMLRRVRRSAVNRENIYVDSEFIEILALEFVANGCRIFNLAVAKDAFALGCIGIVKGCKTASASGLREERQEVFEVLAGHHYIQVVVPGDESFMADCPEQGSVSERICYAVFAAEAVDLYEYVKKGKLEFA